MASPRACNPKVSLLAGYDYNDNKFRLYFVCSSILLLPHKLHDSGQYSFISRFLQESLSFATIEGHSGSMSAQPENGKETIWITGENVKRDAVLLLNYFKQSGS